MNTVGRVNSERYQKYYMDLVEYIASRNTICGSRKVAALLVDPNNKVRGIGFNGPPAGTPHCDHMGYLISVVEPMLDDNKRSSLMLGYTSVRAGLQACSNAKACPRKFLGYKTGELSHMCSCQHAETNAIINAACDISGCALYCTLSPCVNCAGALINARVAEVHFPEGQWYQPQAEFLLRQAQVEIVQHVSVSDQPAPFVWHV